MEQLSIGIPEMKIANLFEDVGILKEVQNLANIIINDDVNFEKEENKKLKNLIANKFTNKIEI